MKCPKMNEQHIIVLLIIGLLIFFYINQKRIIKESFATTERIIEKDDEYIEKIDELVALSNDDSKSADYSELFGKLYEQNLDELNKINKSLINDNVKYNNARAVELNNELIDLEKLAKSKNISLVKKEYDAIQSLQNGMKLNLLSYNDDSGATSNHALIKLNEGCLSVGPSNEPSIRECMPDDQTQHFRLRNIYNELDYDNNIERGLDKIRDSDTIDYPFAMVKSINTDNCLQNNYGKLTVEPCVVRKGQRWTQLDDPVKCII